MTRAEFAQLLARLNAERRTPGQCSPLVCRIVEEGEETARVVNAVLAFEVRTRKDSEGHYTLPGVLATPADLEAVAEVAREIAGAQRMRGAA